jgi:hypothetical protein
MSFILTLLLLLCCGIKGQAFFRSITCTPMGKMPEQDTSFTNLLYGNDEWTSLQPKILLALS